MTKLTKILLLLTAVALPSCVPDTDMPNSAKQDVQMLVSLPEKVLSLASGELVVTDINMMSVSTFNNAVLLDDSTATITLSLPTGYYNLRFSASVTNKDNNTYNIRAYGNRQSINSSQTITVNAYATERADKDFVIAEIFFAGTRTPQGKQYNGDKYFVIANTSNTVRYADGLILMESKFKNSKAFTVTPDIMASDMAVDALYQIPGNGTQYPIQPGGTLLIVDNAIDHRNANSNSFDLSHADFEWYDQSSSATVTDVDNPDVPNLNKIYCYTLTIWIPNNQGNTSFALGRLPDNLSPSEYLSRYRYDYTYINVTQAGVFEQSGSCYRFPNSWITDAVNLCPHSTHEWTVVHESMDAGWAYVAETGSDNNRYGYSVRRKHSVVNGIRTFQDTNNSTEDFLHKQVADPTFFRQ